MGGRFVALLGGDRGEQQVEPGMDFWAVFLELDGMVAIAGAELRRQLADKTAAACVLGPRTDFE